MTTLVITGIGADDVDACGLDKLVGLEDLGIALSDQAGEANLALPGDLLRDLDLSGINLDWYVEASRLDRIGQTVELTGQEQADGVISLSVQLGHLGENE